MQLDNQDAYKKQAAIKAVDFIESNMIIGLGSGSTAEFAIKEIGERIKSGKLKNVTGIPTSINSEKLAKQLGIPLATFEDYQEIDVTIDGADEVDPDLNLIKGGGGALLREKVVAQATKKNVIVVDESKLTLVLGLGFKLPVEVIPFAVKPVTNFIELSGAAVELRKTTSGEIYKTDQQNYILDCKYEKIENASELSAKLNSFAGIVENGLFINFATDVIVAGTQGIIHITKTNAHEMIPALIK